MALEDMVSRFSPQPTITFKKNQTSFSSTIQPIQSILGQNNITTINCKRLCLVVIAYDNVSFIISCNKGIINSRLKHSLMDN